MMRNSCWFVIVAACLLATAPASAQDKKTRYEQRWFYAQYNLLVDKSADDVIALIDRAGKSGYNGMVLADYKLNVLERLPARYFKNVARVKKAATAAGIEIIPTVCAIGYSAGILAHDPNLVEGVPVKDAPFVVKNGEAVLVPNPETRFRNGNLEEVKGDRFVGWSFQDQPGKSSFADGKVIHGGKWACRMQDFTHHHPTGNCRLSQRIKVRPYSCLRFSGWVKTKDVQPIGNFRLLAMGAKEGKVLTFFDDPVKPTQDWMKVEVIFNSLADDEITLFAGIWGGKTGTLWMDDFQLEELSLVNLLRRDGCPLIVASEDGKTTFEEAKDFLAVRDPKLGNDPWAGEYKFAHAGARIQLTKDSRIKNGDKLLVSWYHPILTHSYQVMCCLSEPKVFDIMRDQVKRVNDLLRPKTFFMSHDEIRVANWCQVCQGKMQTPGELLAENVRRCVKIIKDVNPEAQVIVWSDMFDPHHNAVDRYYLVNGSFKNSWDGLPASVMLANWNGGKAAESATWFSKRGHSQILAGYYDGENLESFRHWHNETKNIPGIRGFMYTTYQHRFDQLEAYGKVLTSP